MLSHLLQVTHARCQIHWVLVLTTMVGCVQNTSPIDTADTDSTPIVVPNPVVKSIEGYQATIASKTGSTYYWTATNATITDGRETSSITFTPGVEGTMELSCTIADSTKASRTQSVQIAVVQDTERRYLRVTQQPQGTTVQVGQTATFSVQASGGTPPYTYQWQKNKQNISGATVNRYTTPAIVLEDHNANFRVIVIDSAKHSLNSRQAKIAISGVVPSLNATPSSLFFAYTINGATTQSQQITVTISEGTVNWTATAQTINGGNWLSFTQSGSIVTVLANPSGLATGTYTGTVSIVALGASGSPKSVPVTLAVNPQSSRTGSGIYGTGIGGSGLANTRLGGPERTDVQFMRFRAEQSSNLTAFRFYYLGPPEPGYAGGTGGTWSIGVYADDGSTDHLPTGSPVAAATNVAAQARFNSEAGYLITLTTPVPLSAGNLYHLVFTNTDASPSTNYFSPNFWIAEGVPDRVAGTTPYPSQIHPLMPNSDWGHGYKWAGVWTIREGYLPVIDLTYANGKHQGWSYGEASYNGVDEVGEISGTSKMVREKITVSGSNRTVTGVGIRVLKIAGGTSPLMVRLEDSGGNLIDAFTIPAASIPNGPAPDFTSPISWEDLGAGAKWVSGTFPVPHILTAGQSYRLRLSTAAGTTYWAWVNRRLSFYGYNTATYFSDGVAEYTRDGSIWSYLGRSKGDQDLQFYFSTALN